MPRFWSRMRNLYGSRRDSIIKTYEKMLEDAKTAMRNQEEDKARMLLRRILRWITEDKDKVSEMSDEYKKRVSELLTEAGENMLILKDYDYAIKILEKAKSLDYKNVKAWLDIGRNLLQRNTQIPYGISCLQEAVKIDPDNVEAHILLGDGYRLQGETEKALKEYKRALNLDESNEIALEKILKIEPDNVDVLKKYAEVLEKKGDRENLLVVYNKLASLTNDGSYIEKGLQLDPDNKDLLITKAYTLKQQNKYSEALEVAKNLMEKYPDDPAVQLLHGEIVETEEEFKPIEVEELFGDLGIEGIEELEVGEKPSYEDFLNYYEKAEIEKALEIFERLDDEEKENLIKSYGNLQLAETLFAHGKIQYAEKIVEKLLEKERTDDALYLKARILIEGGQLEEGEKYLNEILKRNIRHAPALFQKARITCVKGNEMGTRNFLTMAIKLSPEIKEMVKEDPILQKYAEKEWFKKLIL